MPVRQWLEPPRHWLVLFLAITLVLAGALGWVSWQLLQQDRALALQRTQERQESAADLATAALQKNLTELEEQLTALAAVASPKTAEFARELPPDSIVVILHSGGIEALPKGRLVYYPVVPAAKEPPASTFLETDLLEFQRRDHVAAITALGKFGRSTDAPTRAAALVRLGRNFRKIGRWPEALGTYEELYRLDSVPVGGLPAGLVAREAKCSLFEQRQDREGLQKEAAALHAELLSARWALPRAAYSFHMEEARRWAGVAHLDPRAEEALALAEGVETLWEEWQRVRRGEGKPAGRAALRQRERPILTLWRASAGRMAALAAGPGYLERRWLRDLQPIVEGHGAEIALVDAQGRPVLGRAPGSDNRSSVRLASATQLPWTLQAFTRPDSPAVATFRTRRRLLLSGLCVAALLLAAGSYFVGRAVARELAVARQQSDFVSAVSHEFRTPLTTLRQLSELLAKGRVATQEHRQQYYDLLLRESERLHRLVEGLLNFGRLEGRKLQYRFERLDAADLLRGTVADFQGEADARGYRLELGANGLAAPVRADREALRCVLWNLFDNAVKYSPDCSTVWVDLEREADRVVIAVRDRGFGIPRSEQEQIFQKFVRGAAAKAQSIRGTGIGLAMARQIVAAHGGRITLESEPGVGSTFRVILPRAGEV